MAAICNALRASRGALRRTALPGNPTCAMLAPPAPAFALAPTHMTRYQATETKEAQAAAEGGMGARFGTTAEVLVSKIFPAGFGWQTASLVADKSFGLGADTMGFALLTGVGDFTGVFLGHTLFYAVKNAGSTTGSDMQVGFWLGSCAFLAGTAWQPTVNALTAAGLGFNSVALGTGAITGAAFLVGLRVFRTAYSGVMSAIVPPDSSNLSADVQLSVSIGGGTACFVGTDVSFADANWLRPLVGVEETTPDLVGCVKAGTSTFLGFGVVQTVQNIVVPKRSCWTDP